MVSMELRYLAAYGTKPKPDESKQPLGTTTCTTASLADSAYVAWAYTGADATSIDEFSVDVYQGNALFKSVTVLDPDTDVIVADLVNGTEYGIEVRPHNRRGYGKPSNRSTVTPKAGVVPSPTLLTCVAGDGFAAVTWDWDAKALPTGYVLEWFSYEATRLDDGKKVTEHIVRDQVVNYKGTCPLLNDVDWSVTLVAVATSGGGKEYLSVVSNAMQVHPEKPVAPYKPRLTGAQIDSGNAGMINVTFSPGISHIEGDGGPGDITAWQVRVTSVADSKDQFTYDVKDGNARKYTTDKVALGSWFVDVRAQNSIGWSEYSDRLTVTFRPTDTRPFTSDKPFGEWESATYRYAIFDPGNDAKSGWDNTWTCTFTEAGKTLPYEFCVIGAGGGGKGQTVTLGKGGDGGGGQITYDQVAPGAATGFTVLVSIGGSTAIDPKDSTLTIGSKTVTALSGKSASSATNANGYPRTAVTTTWLDCTSAFGWLKPDSESVGGVAVSGKQGYPNGLGWGCAGAGTKNSTAGKGVEGLVIVRWAK